MYKIIEQFSETTFVAKEDNGIFILKKSGFEDIELIKALSSVKNRHIAACYGTTVIDGEVYAVCEYVSGETLEKYIERNGVLSDDEVKRIACDICDGLSAIHSKEIVHRDITPSNIIISGSGEIKIIDFGISRTIKKNASNDTQILGTHGYAAPEQFGFRQTTAKADVYAVGVLINYMKTGCLPGEKLAEGYFRPIIEKCIRMDEADRYENAQELRLAVLSEKKKKRVFSELIYHIPGFSKSNQALNIISVLYYLFALFMFTGIRRSGKEAILGDYIPMIFIFWIPYFLIWNIGGWTDKLGFAKEKNKTGHIMVIFAAVVISFFIAAVFIYAFPENNI